MLKRTAVSIAPEITTHEYVNLLRKIPYCMENISCCSSSNLKGSNHTCMSNYRLISLLPILSTNLLEKHTGLISNQLSLHHPIAIQQWEFQPKKSSVSTLIDVVYKWSKALDQGSEVCAVFFDLQKAFDSVPHNWQIQINWFRPLHTLDMLLFDGQKAVCCPEWWEICSL